jgi:hypothetical protein
MCQPIHNELMGFYQVLAYCAQPQSATYFPEDVSSKQLPNDMHARLHQAVPSSIGNVHTAH